MATAYPFSYTTADIGIPSSTVTVPSHGAVLNSSAPNPYTISGSASDNVAVTDIEVSINGGAWQQATCSGCPGTNVNWTYSWNLPANGSYTIQSRAFDSSSNIETPGAGNTVTVDRIAPNVSSTIPADGATGVALNSNVTITWDENVDCSTVNTTNITSDSPGWTLSTCSGTQAVFITSGQSSANTYSVNVTTAVRDAAGNQMTAPYPFSYTTADIGIPSSTITVPSHGAILNSSTPNPYTISGSASDNVAVTAVQVSINGGAWQPAACSGCPGTNVNWTYSWSLPSDGSYTIQSRAFDSSSNIETPGAGNTVTVDRTAPSVSSTNPANGATGVAVNSPVTINWNDNIDCATVNTTNITSTSPGWTLSTCSGTQAVFIASGQSGTTTYSVDVSTAVRDAAGNQMTAPYSFSYTTADISPPSSTITAPAHNAILNSSEPNPYTISGDASDNVAVTAVQVSINGGAWQPAACSGCPGTNVNWTYSWSLPSDGTYTIQSRAIDSSSSVESPSAGNTVTVDRTAPNVSSTIPADGATGVALNSTVTINWNENVDCATVNTTNITSTSPGWTLFSCAGSQATFIPSGQNDASPYAVNITTNITDSAGNPMTAPHSFSYTTADETKPTSFISNPSNGAVLNNSTPDPYTIDGTASDNIAVNGVEVSINGGAWQSAACTGCPGTNVTWTYSWTLPADGPYTIQSRASDSSANQEIPSAGISVTIDQTAPSVSSTIPADGATGITINSSVTINWDENIDCLTVSTTNVTSDSPGWLLSTCSGSQAIFLTSGQDDSTTYNVNVTTAVMDASGNPMTAPYSISYTTADTTSPTSAITDPADGAVLNSASPDPYTIDGTASDNVEVNTVEVSIDGGAWQEATCSGCPGTNVTWTYSWTLLADGIHTIRSRATDSSNNIETPTLGNTVTIDRTGPLVSSTSPVNGETDVTIDSSVTIDWNENVDCTTVDTTSVTISPVVGWTKTSCSGSQAVFTPSGQAGVTPYTVTVSTAVTDAAGNPMASNYQFSYTTRTADSLPPTSSVTDPGDGSAVNGNAPNPYSISGAASDNVNVSSIDVSIDGGPWQPATCAGCPGPNVTWTYSWSLPSDGIHTIQSRASDAAGNVETASAGNTVTVDRTSPSYAWNAPSPGSFYRNGDTISVDATITESGTGIADGANCNALIDSSGAGFSGVITYSVATQKCTGTLFVTGLTDGAHSLTLQVIDLAGNSQVSPGRAINVDNTSPSSSVSDPADGATINNSAPNPYTVSGTATDAVGVQSIEVSVGGGPWTPANCSGCPGTNVTWTHSWTLPVDGIYVIVSRATDSTGNIETPGAGNTVTIERSGPIVSYTVPSDGASNVTLNSPVTITWIEDVDCATVTTANIYIDADGWSLTSCGANQAVFTPDSQSNSTSYLVTITTGVKDTNGNPMATPYGFTYTTSDTDVPSLSYPAAPFDNGVDPDTGDTRNNYTFKVIYTDAQDDPPAAGYPVIFIGDNDGYYGYSMTEEDPLDTLYSDGKTYYFSTGLGAAEDLRYFFEAQAASGDTSTVNMPNAAPGYETGPAVYLLSGYNLSGVPKDLGCNCRSYTSVLGDDSGYQYCQSWDSFGPDPAGGDWIDNTYGSVVNGSGYYIYSDGAARRLDEPSIIGNEPRLFVDILLDVQGGWTMISNPYNAFIELQDVVVVRGGTEYTYSQAVAFGWVGNSIYEWEGDGNGFSFKAFNGSPPAVLEPWMGYYIHVYDSVPTTLRIYAP
jgi:plastocyanin